MQCSAPFSTNQYNYLKNVSKLSKNVVSIFHISVSQNIFLFALKWMFDISGLTFWWFIQFQWCIVLKKIILELRKINLHGNRRPFFLSWLYYFFFCRMWLIPYNTHHHCVLIIIKQCFLIFVKKFNINVNTKTVSEHPSAVYNNFMRESVFSLICVNYAVCTH